MAALAAAAAIASAVRPVAGEGFSLRKCSDRLELTVKIQNKMISLNSF